MNDPLRDIEIRLARCEERISDLKDDVINLGGTISRILWTVGPAIIALLVSILLYFLQQKDKVIVQHTPVHKETTK